MAKKAYVYSGTDWVPLASEVTDLTPYSTSTEIANTYATKAENGLVHINTTSFSGAVSHSFGSDASPIFTSDYTNYKIILENLNNSTGNQAMNFRLRANTTDLTASNYARQILDATGATVGASRNTSTTSYELSYVGYSSDRSFCIVEVMNPQTTEWTSIFASSGWTQTGGGPTIGFRSGYVFNTNQYNGFTIFSTNNFSGTMNVFGYKK